MSPCLAIAYAWFVGLAAVQHFTLMGGNVGDEAHMEWPIPPTLITSSLGLRRPS
jgi:hypothetical protein